MGDTTHACPACEAAHKSHTRPFKCESCGRFFPELRMRD